MYFNDFYAKNRMLKIELKIYKNEYYLFMFRN